VRVVYLCACEHTFAMSASPLTARESVRAYSVRMYDSSTSEHVCKYVLYERVRAREYARAH